MKLLSSASEDILLYSLPFLSYRGLWDRITYDRDLLFRKLLCNPFKINGAWTAALSNPSYWKSL